MKNKITIIGLFIVIISLSSCSKLYEMNQPDDPKTEFSSTYPLSGEWWVIYYDDAALTNDFGGGYYPLYTYNTAANDGKEFWIWDANTFWYYRIKCPVNMTDKTFAGTDIVSTAIDPVPAPTGTLYDIKVNVTNGKVIENVGRSTSGVAVDSIYLELKFEDDTNPTRIFYAAGHRRTGFLEDEH